MAFARYQHHPVRTSRVSSIRRTATLSRVYRDVAQHTYQTSAGGIRQFDMPVPRETAADRV